MAFNFDPRLLGAIGKGLMTGDNASEQLANAFGGIADYRKQNKTMEMLGRDYPELAQAVGAGLITPTEGFGMALKDRQERKKAQTPNRKFQTLPDGTYGFADETAATWTPLGRAPKGGANGDDELGLNLVYGQDADGNTVGFQPSKAGGLRPVTLPPGVRLTPGTSTVDLGTSIGIRDNRSGDIIQQVPKDVAGAASAGAEGKAAGEAKAALPGARAMATELDRQINSLSEDPYLDRMVGPMDSRLPNWSASSARVQSKLDQLGGGAFLQARDMLKGGGAITDFESKRAEAAFARLNTAQNEGDFREALEDFRYWVQAGVTKLEERSGAGQGGAGAPSGGPTVNDLLRKYGG